MEHIRNSLAALTGRVAEPEPKEPEPKPASEPASDVDPEQAPEDGESGSRGSEQPD